MIFLFSSNLIRLQQPQQTDRYCVHVIENFVISLCCFFCASPLSFLPHFMSFVYLFFFFDRELRFCSRSKDNFALLAFFFVHRCTCICFLVSFHFFLVFSVSCPKQHALNLAPSCPAVFFLICVLFGRQFGRFQKKFWSFHKFWIWQHYNHLFVLVSFLFRHLQKVRYLYQIRLHVCILFCFLCSFNRTNVFFFLLRFLRCLIFLWFLILFSF